MVIDVEEDIMVPVVAVELFLQQGTGRNHPINADPLSFEFSTPVSAAAWFLHPISSAGNWGCSSAGVQTN